MGSGGARGFGPTFEESGQVVERPVVRAAVPAGQGQPVVGLEAKGFPAAIHHHHLGRVSVEAGDVLWGGTHTDKEGGGGGQ